MDTHRDCVRARLSSSLPGFFALLVLLCLFYCNYGEEAVCSPLTAQRIELRVVTFNILHGNAQKNNESRWENRRELVLNILRENQPDIVGLQEALRFQLDQIRQGFGQYREIGVGRDDGKTQGEYCAILYRLDRFDVDESGTFWLCDTPEVPGSITWGNACTRICTWARFIEKKSRLAFYAFNLHLDHVSQPSREKSVVLLAKRIAGRKWPDFFIVTGDFNAGEDNPAILYLRGKRLSTKTMQAPRQIRFLWSIRSVCCIRTTKRLGHSMNCRGSAADQKSITYLCQAIWKSCRPR